MQPIIIKRDRVRVQPAPRGASAARAPGALSATEPTVALLAHDGVVHALEVRCGCGAVHVVELEYPTESEDPPPPPPAPTEDV